MPFYVYGTLLGISLKPQQPLVMLTIMKKEALKVTLDTTFSKAKTDAKCNLSNSPSLLCT